MCAITPEPLMKKKRYEMSSNAQPSRMLRRTLRSGSRSGSGRMIIKDGLQSTLLMDSDSSADLSLRQRVARSKNSWNMGRMRAHLRRHRMSREAVGVMSDQEVESRYREMTGEDSSIEERTLGTTLPPTMRIAGTNVTIPEDEFKDNDDDIMSELERSCVQFIEEYDGEWDDHGSHVSMRRQQNK